MLHQNKWQFSCHQIGWCKYTYFTVYWPISKTDQAKSQSIAFDFIVPRRRKINKNRDHTTSMVHMQARLIIRRNLQVHRSQPEYGTKRKAYMKILKLARFICIQVGIGSPSSTRSLSNWNELKKKLTQQDRTS